MLGPLTAGFLFDRMASYAGAFFLAALAFALSGILALAARPAAALGRSLS